VDRRRLDEMECRGDDPPGASGAAYVMLSPEDAGGRGDDSWALEFRFRVRA
jgi:hypothetical protein